MPDEAATLLEDQAVRGALANQRLAALLEKYGNGKAQKWELVELRGLLGGRLPHEPAPIATPPTPPAPKNESEIPRLPPSPVRRSRAAPVLVSVARRRSAAVRAWLVGICRRAFRARPSISIGGWAEGENLTIPAEESHGSPGPYRENTEPVANVIHKFLLDPRYKVFIGLKPSRMGFTLAVLVAIAYWIAHFASNIIYCIDDQKQAKKLSRTRLIPLLQSIRGLKEFLPTNKKKLTALALYLKGITLHLAGAKSISDVTSITAGLVVGDEVDQWADFASGEASAYHHLLDRVMDVPGGKACFFGKPRNETDILWTEYLTGTRHKCFVPCPHCGHMQTLNFDNLKFDHLQREDGNFDLLRMKREVYYLCASPECQRGAHQGRIHEYHKHRMLAALDWRQTYFGEDPDYQLDPEKMSVSVNQLYSLRPELTWGNIASHFVKARKQGGAALAHYFRTRFGEPERKAQAITKKEEILKLQHYVSAEKLRAWWREGRETHSLDTCPRTGYKHGHCPFAPAAVLMFCDVQTVLNEKKAVKMAFSPSGEAVVIDYKVFMSFNQLIAFADEPVVVDDWGDTPKDEQVDPVVESVWIDEGGGDKNEVAVREFCVREDTMGRFFPSKGAGGEQIKQVVEEKTRIVTDRDGVDHELPAYHFSHNTFASELFYRRIKKHDEILMAIAQELDPEAQPIWIPKHPDDQFVAEMTAEHLIKKRVRGRWDYVWEKTGKRINDFPDGVKGCLAMWHFIKGDYADVSGEYDAPPVDDDEEEEAEPDEPDTPPGTPPERDYTLYR